MDIIENKLKPVHNLYQILVEGAAQYMIEQLLEEHNNLQEESDDEEDKCSFSDWLKSFNCDFFSDYREILDYLHSQNLLLEEASKKSLAGREDCIMTESFLRFIMVSSPHMKASFDGMYRKDRLEDIAIYAFIADVLAQVKTKHSSVNYFDPCKRRR